MPNSKITEEQALAIDLPAFGIGASTSDRENEEWLEQWWPRARAMMILLLDADDNRIRILSQGYREDRKALGEAAGKHVASEDVLDIEEEMMRQAKDAE